MRLSLEAGQAGAYVKFDLGAGGVVGCKTASSFISAEQALRNLDSEIGDADFNTVRQRAEARWNEALNRARIDGGTLDQRRTFYSALYRGILYPHRFYELDENRHQVYYSPYDGKIHQGVLYTDSGFWDTFRAAHPLYNLLFPEISAEILQGLMNAYDQSGWLPSWASPGHRACMIGNHAFSLLADGWAKGIRSFDPDKAVTAMVHDANTQGPRDCGSIGRDGAEFYQKLGYVPYSNVRGEPSVSEATAKTLEYAYDDFCLSQLAGAAGRKAEAEDRRESRVDGAVLPGSEFLGATIGFSEVSADFDASDFQRRRAGIRQRHGHCGAGRPLGDVAEIEARGRQRDHRFVQQYTGGTYVAADRRSIGRRQIQTTVFVEISGRDSPWQCACSQYLLGWKRAVALA